MLTCSKDVQRMFASDGPSRRCRTYLAQAQHTCTNDITPNQRRSSTYSLHQRVPSSILTGTIDTATNMKATRDAIDIGAHRKHLLRQGYTVVNR